MGNGYLVPPVRLGAVAQALGVSVELLLSGGPEWGPAMRRITRISSPHVFDVPTQYDPALSADAGAPVAVDVYRAKETDLPAAPVAPKATPKVERKRERTPEAAAPVSHVPVPGPHCRICQRRGSFVCSICPECWFG